jgi:hypothetical protein
MVHVYHGIAILEYHLEHSGYTCYHLLVRGCVPVAPVFQVVFEIMYTCMAYRYVPIQAMHHVSANYCQSSCQGNYDGPLSVVVNPRVFINKPETMMFFV